MSDNLSEVVSALDALVEATRLARIEAEISAKWRAKVLEFLQEINASTSAASTDAALARQHLAECEMHLCVLAQRLAPDSDL